MKKLIKTILILLPSISLAQDLSYCSGDQRFIIDSNKALEKEICEDPHYIICKKDGNHTSYISRPDKILEQLKLKAKLDLFEEYKDDLSPCGITSVEDFDIDNLEEIRIQQSTSDGTCILNIDPQNPENNLGIIDMMRSIMELKLEEELRKAIDDRRDIAHEAYRLIKDKLIAVMKKELKGKLSPEKIAEKVASVDKTIPLFSVSFKSMNKQFPKIDIFERQKIISGYASICGLMTNPLHNAYYAQYEINGEKRDFMVICPGVTLSGMEESQTLRSLYESYVTVVSHELGHQISINMEDTDIFEKYNQCLRDNIPSSEIKLSPSTYNREAQADFWAKRVLGEVLKEMKDLPVKERIIFMRESNLILCDSEDDGSHHSDQLRINRTLRYTKDFEEAFNCSEYPRQFKMNKPIDCGLDGATPFMATKKTRR